MELLPLSWIETSGKGGLASVECITSFKLWIALLEMEGGVKKAKRLTGLLTTLIPTIKFKKGAITQVCEVNEDYKEYEYCEVLRWWW